MQIQDGTAEPDGVEQATEWLEQITRDPMADAARGSVTILSVTPPIGKRRYQECSIEVRTSAQGLEPASVNLDVVVDSRHWPRVGMVLPAKISRTVAGHMEVDWAALARA